MRIKKVIKTEVPVPQGLSNYAAAIAFCAAIVASEALAAEWPAERKNWFGRGPGGGLSTLLIVLWWVWLPLWTSCSSWVARDLGRWNLSGVIWPIFTVFPFFFAAVAAWWIPSPIAGLAIMGLAWAVPTFAYVIVRNGRAPSFEKVLTPSHILDCFAAAVRPLGIKIKRPPKEVKESLPEVQVADASGKPLVPLSEGEAESAAGLAAVLAMAIGSRATRLVLERNSTAATVRQVVDGVLGVPRKPVAQGFFASKKNEEWENVPPPSSKAAAGFVAMLQRACALEPQSRQPRRYGRCVALSDGKPIPLHVELASGEAAERAIINIELPSKPLDKISDLGVSEKVCEKLLEMLSYDRGLIVVAAPPSNGLTTSFRAVVSSADRMVRDFALLEDSRKPLPEIQNVKTYSWDSGAGVSPSDVLTQAMRSYPQGVVTHDLKDPELAKLLVDMAAGEQLVIVSISAPDSIGAVASLLKMGVPREALSKAVVGVLAGRLIRRLCPVCREAFATPPEMAAKLRFPLERVPQLYRASPIGCRLCRGLGFASRTGIFELAEGKTFHAAILKGDRKMLAQAAVKDGMRPLTMAAVDMVLAGETSLEEQQRVFQKAERP